MKYYEVTCVTTFNYNEYPVRFKSVEEAIQFIEYHFTSSSNDIMDLLEGNYVYLSGSNPYSYWLYRGTYRVTLTTHENR